MNYREKYTTEALKAEIIADTKATTEQKEAENKKLIVTNDAMLSAEMTAGLINELKILRRMR